jgi:tetratricopeptide (TPR) repeat protein
MSNYEFWDELGKIFNAVVAYQEKTIEFNKRFINPWIRLGNVFDKQDRNKEAISAYEKAIEIDPGNAQNWFELGNVHFKMGHYEEAVAAFNKSIELDPGFGWPYSNLALALESQGKHMQAIPLFRKSIDLLTEDKDKAVSWNRLGNVYRKLNEYALAVEAFQKADELDHENAGFRDDLDEVPEAPVVVEADGAASAAEAMPVSVSSLELIVADNSQADATADASSEIATVVDASTELPTRPIAVADGVLGQAVAPEPQPADSSDANSPEAVVDEAGTQAEAASIAEMALPEPEAAVSAPDSALTDAAVAEPASAPIELISEAPAAGTEEPQQPESETHVESVESVQELAVEISVVSVEDVGTVQEPETDQPAELSALTEALGQPADEGMLTEQTVSVVVQTTVETFTETVTVTDTSTETTDAGLTIEEPQNAPEESAPVVDQVGIEVAEPEAELAQAEAPSGVTAPVVEQSLEVAASTETSAGLESGQDMVASAETAPEPAAVIVDATSSNMVEEAASDMVGSEVASAVETPAADPIVLDLPEAVEEAEPKSEETAAHDAPEDSPQAEVVPVAIDATAEPESVATAEADHVAYEEYLKDNNEPVNLFQAEALDEIASPEDLKAAEEPVTKLDPSGDLQIEMDTKNAHVWNELGNVYFNTAAFDDAIIAYSKAIELDRWFAWPYSNLALAYVQKSRFAEAILLYQRSIELFTGDKDKAISWNRLGNVYRRMNDYDNAICAYQRADELDPDNTTLSLQSRFSLLGSYAMEEKPSYAS